MTTDSDDVSWARTHRACYDVAALTEVRGRKQVAVGFTVDLYAALPLDVPAGPERQAEAARIWQRLRTILESVVPADTGGARIEVEPRQAAAFLRRENQLQPEIGLRARVFHGADYFAAVTADERTRLSVLERALKEKGLQAGHW
jgi:hypothetical protein